MIVKSAVRRSAYYDSVTLMQAQQALRSLPGIVEAGVVMGTEANLALLRQAGLDAGVTASADDLVVAVRGDSELHVEAALSSLEGLLQARTDAEADDHTYRPRSIATAVRLLPGANLALISVPGRFAAGLAREAGDAGLHTMVFSDNVALEDEVRLKQASRARGLLCMGPDCGTALIGGTALGFANRVRRGPIGLAAAAGTGLQEVMSTIHRLGGGVSHALGAGGRDLTEPVGGTTTNDGLTLLGRDPATTVVVLVSKPPDPGVARRLLAHAAGVGKPVVVAFVGPRPEQDVTGTLYSARTLEEAGILAVRLAGGAPRDLGGEVVGWVRRARDRAAAARSRLGASQRYLRGLFSGGTLCAEAAWLLASALRPLYTNVAGGCARPLASAARSEAHSVLDLGADEFTVGRLHPMLDMTLRAQRLAQEAADPQVAVLLLDVVLGEGVHPDPAGALAPGISAACTAARAAGRELAVVASVCGTDADPQNRARQVERLDAAGVLVEETNARAAALAGAIVAPAAEREEIWTPFARRALGAGPDASAAPPPAAWGDPPPGTPAGEAPPLLAGPPRVINVGLARFAESLRAQGAAVVDVDWRPPAEGNRAMLDLLEKLE
jgi:FdrA protein